MLKLKSYFLNWQDPESRRWFPVGKLFDAEKFFIFAYTRGALKSKNFLTFGNMSKLDAIYISHELFPIFANRVMSAKRPEFARYASWAGLDPTRRIDPLLLMARMGGQRATDTLQVYPVPEKGSDNIYKTIFFIHGLRHMPEYSQLAILSMKLGDKLFPMLDIMNPHDEAAVAIRSNDPATLVGYCPRYISEDIATIVNSKGSHLEIKIKKINYDAPTQFRILCEAKSKWPEKFSPCSNEEQKTIVEFDPKAISERMRGGIGSR